MSRLLSRAGYIMSDSMDDASLIVLETCAIRQKAEDKVGSMLGRLRKRREAGEDLKIAVAGCMATEADVRGLIRKGVDIILGPRRIARIAETVESQDPVVDLGEEWLLPSEDISAPDIIGFSAFVTVMQGCSNACTFCVVPSRRGQAESKPLDAILREIKVLESEGYREVTLLGQNISYYGLDRPKQPRLIDLLEAVDAGTSLDRVRFATSHPAYIDKDFIERFGRLTKVMPHFHLPVQSGSDRMLRLMRRGYTVARYLEIIDGIRESRPGTAITTDIITGFDGEDSADHEATLALVERAAFDSAYVFAYSERPRTGATLRNLGEKVPPAERLRRCHEVLSAVERVSGESKRALVGEVVPVLVEKPGFGRTPQNVSIRFTGGTRGEIKPVKIESATAFVLAG